MMVALCLSESVSRVGAAIVYMRSEMLLVGLRSWIAAVAAIFL